MFMLCSVSFAYLRVIFISLWFSRLLTYLFYSSIIVLTESLLSIKPSEFVSDVKLKIC